MYRRTAIRLLTALTLTATLLAACGDDDPVQDAAVQDSADRDGASGEGGQDDGHQDDHEDPSEAAPDARRIEVTADDFAFEPAEITAEAGEDLLIVLTSGDMLHDFTIDELDAHVAAGGGETAEGGFTADEPGTYTYYCSVPGHQAAGMEGTLVEE